jgi:hypothetical protein
MWEATAKLGIATYSLAPAPLASQPISVKPQRSWAGRLDTQRAQILAAVHSDSTDGLRAKVATLEAVQRNSPPDSESFRSATSALLVINEELAKRGALK